MSSPRVDMSYAIACMRDFYIYKIVAHLPAELRQYIATFITHTYDEAYTNIQMIVRQHLRCLQPQLYHCHRRKPVVTLTTVTPPNITPTFSEQQPRSHTKVASIKRCRQTKAVKRQYQSDRLTKLRLLETHFISDDNIDVEIADDTIRDNQSSQQHSDTDYITDQDENDNSLRDDEPGFQQDDDICPACGYDCYDSSIGYCKPCWRDMDRW